MKTLSLNAPDPALLQALSTALGPAGVRDPADAPAYLEEPRGKYPGDAALIVRPRDVDEVAYVVRQCAAARVGVVPWSGGTGLVGGQTRRESPPCILLSVDRMTAIRDVDREDAAITVEAGAVLADVQRAAEEAGLLFPLSLAAEGSCRIGGNLATNAGGVGVLRYGNARDLCLGVEAVLPNGEILRRLKTLRKDNSGYDLRHLLIGAEGTLGVITAATLRLFPRPRAIAAALCAVESPAAAVALLRRTQDVAGETVSTFELLSAQGIAFAEAELDDVTYPLDTRAPWSVLMEIGAADAETTLETALTAAYADGQVLDAAIAANESQRAAFWRLREGQPEANRRIGALASHDVSTPVRRLPGFIAAAEAAMTALDPAMRINCFGHVGDGNLHYNVFPPVDRAARISAAEVTRAIHDLVVADGGSFAAEHGVGRAKAADLARYGDPASLAAMRAIKQALDPYGVMNPGAVFGDETR